MTRIGSHSRSVASSPAAPAAARVATPRSSWARKNMLIDQHKLDRAKKMLGVATETAAVDAALDFVAFRDEVVSGVRKLRAAGGLADIAESL